MDKIPRPELNEEDHGPTEDKLVNRSNYIRL